MRTFPVGAPSPVDIACFAAPLLRAMESASRNWVYSSCPVSCPYHCAFTIPLASKTQYVFFGTNVTKLSKLMLNMCLCLLYSISKEWLLFYIDTWNFDLLTGRSFSLNKQNDAFVTDFLHFIIEKTVSIKGKPQGVFLPPDFKLCYRAIYLKTAWY